MTIIAPLLALLFTACLAEDAAEPAPDLDALEVHDLDAYTTPEQMPACADLGCGPEMLCRSTTVCLCDEGDVVVECRP